jgi:transcriptional regulator with XRE-family HTH domain
MRLKKPKPTGRAARVVTDVDRLVGENVRRFRNARGMTLAELSLGLGISHQQLQKYETGMNRLSAGILMDVSKLLDVSLTELFETGVTKQDRSRSAADTSRRMCQAIVNQTESPAKLALMARILKVIRDSP